MSNKKETLLKFFWDLRKPIVPIIISFLNKHLKAKGYTANPYMSSLSEYDQWAALIEIRRKPTTEKKLDTKSIVISISPKDIEYKEDRNILHLNCMIQSPLIKSTIKKEFLYSLIKGGFLYKYKERFIDDDELIKLGGEISTWVLETIPQISTK